MILLKKSIDIYTGDTMDINDINKKINKKSVIPIYYQLAKLLEKKIYTGELNPGEKLPPENKIADYFNISRMTVRKALSELIEAGMISSEKGRGTFVTEPKLDNLVFELDNFKEEIEKRGMKPKIKLLKVNIIKANREIANKLNIDLKTRCLDFTMLISANNEPLIYERKYIKYSKQKPILESELEDATLSNLAITHGNYFPVMSKKILKSANADKEQANLLNINKKDAVFVIEQYLYDTNNSSIGWGISVCRGDKFKFSSYSGWSNESNDIDQKRGF